MDDKRKIIKNLRKHRKQLQVMVKNLEALDTTDDLRLNRILVNAVTITLFEFIDEMVNTEADIYNFFKRRG